MPHALLIVIGSGWWTDSAPLLRQPTFPRLLLALVLGMCIGAERQWRQRAAGLRTNTLVCLGAAAFVDLGFTIAPTSVQVIAYVISGVGFLGAGAIMKDGANVRGLNTAATLWCSAAVGACAGAGELLDAVFVTALLIVVNSVLRPLSHYIDRRSLATLETSTLHRLRVVCEADKLHETEDRVTRLIAEAALALKELRSEENDETGTAWVSAVLEAPTANDISLRGIVKQLEGTPWIESVEVMAASTEIE